MEVDKYVHSNRSGRRKAENGEQIYPIENVHENDGSLPYEVMVRINIRSKPSLEADKIDIADAGTILEAFEDLGDWLRIRWNGSEAYARHKGFEYIKEAV